ncbi:hypothetical protein CPT03_21865 [Pedobacter ginsengisoli]|uniref:Transcriptional regulator n=1 Tax=Pedobacter ginsengisoli TaxID=363852 RepID=A0A2D1UBN4_9SPHI|nr:hypothetical protein [Pedobacter ginsengisoli]ATP58924.1 hypothetical protein CPT03_21865 [Pedobacter ginsengisoli]
MDIQAGLKELSNQPLTHRLLAGLLKNYKRPNDKILSLKADGLIEPVKKGLYIAGRSLGVYFAESGEEPLSAKEVATYGIIPI